MKMVSVHNLEIQRLTAVTKCNQNSHKWSNSHSFCSWMKDHIWSQIDDNLWIYYRVHRGKIPCLLHVESLQCGCNQQMSWAIILAKTSKKATTKVVVSHPFFLYFPLKTVPLKLIISQLLWNVSCSRASSLIQEFWPWTKRWWRDPQWLIDSLWPLEKKTKAKAVYQNVPSLYSVQNHIDYTQENNLHSQLETVLSKVKKKVFAFLYLLFYVMLAYAADNWGVNCRKHNSVYQKLKSVELIMTLNS